MLVRKLRTPLSLCTTSVALVIASSFSTAHADPAGVPNIPDATPKSAALAGLGSDAPASGLEPDTEGPPAGSTSDLPLPYAPWQGKSFGAAPPREAREAPLPFTRSPELRRRPLELTLAPAAFLPSCGTGSIDSRGCSSVALGAGFEGALLYRVVPFFGFGLEGALSGFGGAGHGALSRAGGAASFIGLVGRAYFADAGSWDPYASLSMGYASLELRDESARTLGAARGFGGRVTGGVDYLLGSHFRVGPTLGFGHVVAWSERDCRDGVCRNRPLAHGRVLGFATLGLRLTGTWGDRL